MSWQAVNWANEQRMDNPSQQLVLLLLANWATPEGDVRLIDVANLIECSRQSRASVFRRLREIEDYGLLSREPDGRRGDGSPRISGKLNLDRRFAAGSTDPEGGQSQVETEGQSQSDTTPPVDKSAIEGGAVSLVRLAYKDSTRQEESSPTDPPQFDEGAAEEDVASNPDPPPPSESPYDREAAWRTFVAAYPFDPTMNAPAAKAEFLRLSQRDQKAATIAAGRYREAQKLRRRDFARSADKWLHNREFDVVMAAGKAAAERGGGAPTVFVRAGTPAWDRWQDWLRRAGDRRVGLKTRSEERRADGWYFATLFPPGEDEGAGVADEPNDL